MKICASFILYLINLPISMPRQVEFLKKNILLASLLLFPLFFLLTIQNPQADFVGTLEGNEVVPETSAGEFISSTNECIKLKIMPDGSTRSVTGTCPGGIMTEMIQAMTETFIGKTQITSSQGSINQIHFIPGITQSVVAYSGRMLLSDPTEPFTVQAQNTFKDISNKLNPVNSVYAQQENKSTSYFPGLGYNLLAPIRSIYNMSRNIAYGLLIIVVMVNALLILLRRKLGQEEITIANSIPSIILSLILISSAYAIAGLFVDFISIGTNFAQYVLVAAPGAPGHETVWNGTRYITYNSKLPELLINTSTVATGEINKICRNGTFDCDQEDRVAKNMDGKLGIQPDDPLMSVWLVFGAADIKLDAADLAGLQIVPQYDVINRVPLIGGLISSLGKGLEGTLDNGVGGGAASGIINLVFAISLFMASIKIFLKLMQAYITMLILPGVAPLMFLIAALPSMTSKMISAFVNPMLGSALKFILVYTLFLVIIVITYEPLLEGFQFTPPLLGYGDGSSVGATANSLKVLIAYGLYLSIPVIVDGLDKQIGAMGGGEYFGNIAKETKSSAGRLFGVGQGLFQSQKNKYFPEGH